MTPARAKKTTDLSDKKRFIKLIKKLNRAHPDAKLDLNFSNPLELLIALILAAQTRDSLVNQPRSEKIIEAFPDLSSLGHQLPAY